MQNPHFFHNGKKCVVECVGVQRKAGRTKMFRALVVKRVETERYVQDNSEDVPKCHMLLHLIVVHLFINKEATVACFSMLV